MVKTKDLMNYAIKGFIVWLLCIPGAIIGAILSIFGGVIGSILGLVAGFVVTGYMFVKYYKK